MSLTSIMKKIQVLVLEEGVSERREKSRTDILLTVPDYRKNTIALFRHHVFSEFFSILVFMSWIIQPSEINNNWKKFFKKNYSNVQIWNLFFVKIFFGNSKIIGWSNVFRLGCFSYYGKTLAQYHSYRLLIWSYSITTISLTIFWIHFLSIFRYGTMLTFFFGFGMILIIPSKTSMQIIWTLRGKYRQPFACVQKLAINLQIDSDKILVQKISIIKIRVFENEIANFLEGCDFQQTELGFLEILIVLSKMRKFALIRKVSVKCDRLVCLMYRIHIKMPGYHQENFPFPFVKKNVVQKNFHFTCLPQVDATNRTKYQIRTRDRFGPKTNSAQNFNYLHLVIVSNVYKKYENCNSS